MNRKKSIFLKPTFYYHSLYWICNVLFFTFIFWSRDGNNDLLRSLHVNAAYLPAGMIFTYLSVDYLIPRFFFNNKIGLYILSQVMLLAMYPVVSNMVLYFYISPVIYHLNTVYTFYSGFLSTILILVFDIVPLAGVKILNRLKYEALLRQESEHIKTQSELKLREAELKLLKGQINPHFLFNTLNNLYSLSLEKSDKTPDLLIRLSDMLSYITYDCASDKVPLTKEVDFISNYIELQKVRYETCRISFAVTGELDNKQIAPMILHTFVDNSFKHGTDIDSENTWIHITITAKDEFLFLAVINSIRSDYENKKDHTGIGLDNTNKRLDLLYPDKYDLVVNDSNEKYSVFLKLEL